MTNHIQEVDSAPGLREIHGELLAPAFPARELVDVSELLDRVNSGDWTVLAARGRDSWLGVAVVQWFPGNLVLLVYLAVAQGHRGGGLGRDLLLAAMRQSDARGCRFLLAEIEPPGVTPERPEFGDPRRRALFYQAAGGVALDIPHWQPAIGAGQPAVRLTLLALPTTSNGLDAVDGWRIEQFERSYHQADPESSELAETLAALEPSRKLSTTALEALYT
jgi:GNAT superfamily N-acetyltransferase